MFTPGDGLVRPITQIIMGGAFFFATVQYARTRRKRAERTNQNGEETSAKMNTTAAMTVETIADQLARDIQSGHLRAGTWLKQIDLQNRFDCQRSHVRQALDILVMRRFVQHERNRGYYVYEISPEQFLEYSEIRVILETAAAESVIEKATADDIHQLRKLAAAFEQTVVHGNLMDNVETNGAFHRYFNDLSGNGELSNLIAEYRKRGPAAPVLQWRTHKMLLRSAREHFAIVDALEARDTGLLKERIALHISQAARERMKETAMNGVNRVTPRMQPGAGH